ncbi:MAG: T9SS type A sorting domain-containing protein [Bacteroidales bacterium]|nr:T9SS type A sorting domain-containing protein [Bacteroidales bacterium]
MRTIIYFFILLINIWSATLSAQVISLIDYTYSPRGQINSISENGISLTYYYDAAGNRITHSQTLGVFHPQHEKQQLIIYPNPVKSRIKIEFELLQPEQAMVYVFSVRGEQLIAIGYKANQSGKQSYEMDVTDLTCGLYSVRIVSNSFTGTSKLIKID